jgi:ABC-type multidrug transport system permease subunit
MQQDVHEPKATVREALEFSARLRQPRDVPDEEKTAYVEHIIHLLELEAIADALIGEPGDGQLGVEERKRVTIGVELAARPSSLLFLDEPTSGLDSQAAFTLVSFLQRIAAEGIPVVCTIHQPSGVLFDMFDHVLLLAPGGRTVYFGETGDNSGKVIDYFSRHGALIGQNDNPAEFIISTVTSQDANAKDWPAAWNESAECKAVKIAITQLNAQETGVKTQNQEQPDEKQTSATQSDSQFALPLWAQIEAVTKRHWISVWRDGMYNFSKIAKSLFVEMFIAFSFFQVGNDVQGLQNRMVSILLLSWVVPAVSADIQDMWFRKWEIFTAREKNGIYDWKALLAALIVVELPWQLGTYSLIFLTTYWTIGFPSEAAIAGINYFMWLLLAIFGTSYSQLLAAMFPNAVMSGYANSLFWVILMVFSGVLTPHAYLNSFYRPWIFWADPMRYFFGATVATVQHGLEVQCKAEQLTSFDPPPGQDCATYSKSFLEKSAGYLLNGNATENCQYCQYSVGDDYTKTLDYGYSQRWWNWAVFVGFCLSNIMLLFVITWWTKGRLQRRQ